MPEVLFESAYSDHHMEQSHKMLWEVHARKVSINSIPCCHYVSESSIVVSFPGSMRINAVYSWTSYLLP
jgi:hypothetical protein